MDEYNLAWLKGKGFFGKTVPLPLNGKDVSVDDENSLAYIEVKSNEEIEGIRRGLSSHKVRYMWFYFPSERKLKAFRKIGEVKWFFYSPMMKGEYLKSRVDKLNKFSPSDVNILFDIKDVVNQFYWQLWKARIRMAKSVEQLKEEKNKLLAVQHLIDRLIFFYFLSQLGLVNISTGNGERIWKLDRTHTRKFFRWICDFLDDEVLQEFLNRIFFDVLGKSEGGGWSGLEFNIGGERFSVVAPSLNGGLFREEKIEGIEESEIKIEGTKGLILDILNKYNWIIGEESPEEEDVIGDLTPEIIGHIYEKFVVSLEQIGLEKIGFDDIQTVKGELKSGRKKIGAYYTPEEITNYISMNTIYPYITDRINERFKRRYRNIWNELLNKEKLTKERLTEEEVEKVKFLYFEVLKKLRICDNACGSGSFLIAAGEVLLRLYSRVIKLLKNYQGEDEEVKEILEDIKRSPSRNYYIVRQIITNNLHGVDIMEGAVEIAKLRLWLWLISQVMPKEAEYEEIETLPNLDYNLVVGNSLIGFVDIKDIANTLSSWLGESKEGWLKNLAKEKQKFKTLSARDAERLKAKLDVEIEKAREFLHSKFFEMVKAKGIEMPYKDYDDFAEDLKPFHWGFEFYEAFDLAKPKEERGFDIIIGNPPYVSAWEMEESNILSRRILPKIYSDKFQLKSHWDLYIPFILQATNIAKNDGYFSYILPNPICREKYAVGIRRYILENSTIKQLLTARERNVFIGVSRQSIVFVLKLVPSIDQENEITVQFIDENDTINTINKTRQKIWYDLHQSQFRYEVDSTTLEIINKLNKTRVRLGNIYYINLGAQMYSKKKGEFGKQYLLTKEPKENPKKFFEGKDITRYGLRYRDLYMDYLPNMMYDGKCIELFESPKIITRQISGKNDSLIFTLDREAFYCDHNLILATDYKNLKPEDRTKFRGYDVIENHGYTPEFILDVLNSKLMSFFYKNVYATGSLQGSYSHVYPQHVRDFPIVNAPPNQQPFIVLCDYMLFLNETEERRKTGKELIDFIDHQIIDSLVYELYFKEKFEEDGLKTNLLGLVEPYLKDIENLKSDEEKLKVIKEVVERITGDRKVKREIEKIKSHELVKVIEKE